MKALLFTLLLLLPLSAFANAITKEDLSNFNNLTEVQKAVIITNIAEAEAVNAASGVLSIVDTSTVQPEQVDKWVNTGERIGKMLGGTAKELGLAANEFARSPLGMVTMGLIIWNYAGDDLAGFIVGFFWLVVMVPLWSFLFLKIAYPITGYTDKNVKRPFRAPATISKAIRDFSGDGSAAVAGLIIFVVIVLIGVLFLA